MSKSKNRKRVTYPEDPNSSRNLKGRGFDGPNFDSSKVTKSKQNQNNSSTGLVSKNHHNLESDYDDSSLRKFQNEVFGEMLEDYEEHSDKQIPPNYQSFPAEQNYQNPSVQPSYQNYQSLPTQNAETSPNSFFYYLSRHTVFGTILILLTGLVVGFLAYEALAPENARISKRFVVSTVSSLPVSNLNSSANSVSQNNSSSSQSSQVSSSQSSNSTSSVSSSSSSSSSVSSSPSLAPIANPKIYTNQYFPNFKLVYPDDWKFETSTTPNSNYQNLLNRSIKLKKGSSTLEIGIAPLLVPSGCGGGDASESYQNITQITSELKRFQDKSNQNLYEYAKNDPSCFLEKSIESTIKGRDIKFKDNNWKNWWIESYGSLDATSKFNYKIVLNTNDSKVVTKIDQIIAQSSFN